MMISREDCQSYAYNFGRSIAHHQRLDTDLIKVYNEFTAETHHMAGSHAERDCLIGAFDEYKRIVSSVKIA